MTNEVHDSFKEPSWKFWLRFTGYYFAIVTSFIFAAAFVLMLIHLPSELAGYRELFTLGLGASVTCCGTYVYKAIRSWFSYIPEKDLKFWGGSLALVLGYTFFDSVLLEDHPVVAFIVMLPAAVAFMLWVQKTFGKP